MTTDTAPLPPMLTIEQLAAHLECSYDVARHHVVYKEAFGPKDKLPKLGRQYRIPRVRVEAFCRGDLEGAKA